MAENGGSRQKRREGVGIHIHGGILLKLSVVTLDVLTLDACRQSERDPQRGQ
jgi:uncharacterized protein YigE (DUF2233 family)